MFKTEFDIVALTRSFSDLEKRQIPFALAGALNDTAFQAHERWKKLIPTVFDQPTPWTRVAPLYTKATKQDLSTASVFIRDEAAKGTPPVKYLEPEEFGGQRRQKSFERKLGRHPRARKFYVAGRGAPLDQYGNVPRGVLAKIISQLGVAEDRKGFTANETAAGRKRRLRRQRNKGGGSSYFILATNRGKLKAGVIYERRTHSAISGSEVRSILYPADNAPQYRRRFNAIGIAQGFMRVNFEGNFAKRMAKGIATAR